MGFADYYFTRYKAEEKIIPEEPAANLGLIVIIPCFNEDITIMKALESLYCCMPTEKNTEVIVLVNYPESKRSSLKRSHEEIYTSLLSWSKAHSKPKLKFHIIFKELPNKTAGAGHARKIAMDEALRRFNSIDNKNGIVASFDADCICDSNYLSELEKLFYNEPETKGCSIYFEHPLEGSEYPEENYKAIAQYELYLRYYIEA
jgi:cellulose synthase/poly-beta-1,6-N-acetylglucosamine synthase-like glycosyltransferase